MYATKNGDSRPVTRHQSKETLKAPVGVLWCPWCDTSNQDDRATCGGCEAVFIETGTFYTQYPISDGQTLDVTGWLKPDDDFELPPGMTVDMGDSTHPVSVTVTESYHTPETEPAAGDYDPNYDTIHPQETEPAADPEQMVHAEYAIFDGEITDLKVVDGNGNEFPASGAWAEDLAARSDPSTWDTLNPAPSNYDTGTVIEPPVCQCNHTQAHHSDANGCRYRRTCGCEGFEHPEVK